MAKLKKKKKQIMVLSELGITIGINYRFLQSVLSQLCRKECVSDGSYIYVQTCVSRSIKQLLHWK